MRKQQLKLFPGEEIVNTLVVSEFIQLAFFSLSLCFFLLALYDSHLYVSEEPRGRCSLLR